MIGQRLNVEPIAKGIPELVTSDGPMGVRNQFFDDEWTPINVSDDFFNFGTF